VTESKRQESGLYKISIEALKQTDDVELMRDFNIKAIKRQDMLILSGSRLVHPKSGKWVKSIKKFFDNEDAKALMDFLTLIPSIALCYVDEKANYKNGFKDVECLVDLSGQKTVP